MCHSVWNSWSVSSFSHFVSRITLSTPIHFFVDQDETKRTDMVIMIRPHTIEVLNKLKQYFDLTLYTVCISIH